MQRWWIAVVAVVGIGLAIFLFPSPDTGEVPPPNPDNAQPMEAFKEVEGTVKNPAAVDSLGTRKPRASKAVPFNSEVPVTAADRPAVTSILEIRSRPEAVYAGKLVAPWSGIRYVLERSGDDAAKQLSEEIRPFLTNLNQGRRDPRDVPPLDETLEALEGLAAQVRASAVGNDETVLVALERYEVAVDEYRSKAQHEGAEN